LFSMFLTVFLRSCGFLLQFSLGPVADLVVHLLVSFRHCVLTVTAMFRALFHSKNKNRGRLPEQAVRGQFTLPEQLMKNYTTELELKHSQSTDFIGESSLLDFADDSPVLDIVRVTDERANSN